MAYRVFYSSTVPNSSVLHFNFTEYGQLVSRRAQQILISYREKILHYNSQFTDLVHTTELIFDSEETYRDMNERIRSEFPEYEEKKATYAAENDIVIEKMAFEV